MYYFSILTESDSINKWQTYLEAKPQSDWILLLYKVKN